LNPGTKLMGFVKKSENDSEVLFAFKHDMANWIAIPETMIESVNIIKNIPNERLLTLVILHLKAPSEPEAKILYDLLAILSAKVNKYQRIKWIKKMMSGEDRHFDAMHCKHSHMESKCGHYPEIMHHCGHKD
jgi:hypothetical protein